MNTWIACILAFIAGANFGFLLLALLTAASRYDDNIERIHDR